MKFCSEAESFCISGSPLAVYKSVRDLGVIVNHCKWFSHTPSNHIAKMRAIAHQRVNILLKTYTEF